MNERIDFIVLTAGRTGSTVICDDLDQVDGIKCYQELLRPLQSDEEFVHEPVPFEAFVRSSRFGRRTLAQYLRYVDAVSRHDEHSVLRVGFKILLHHSTLQGRKRLFCALGAGGTRIIRLRRHPVHQVLSGVVARERGRFNIMNAAESSTTDEMEVLPAVRLDIQELLNRITWSAVGERRIDEVVAEWRHPTLGIDYADYLNHRDEVLGQAVRFLGVAAPLAFGRQRFRRMVPDPAGAIENWGEVLAALEEAGFTWEPEGTTEW